MILRETFLQSAKVLAFQYRRPGLAVGFGNNNFSIFKLFPLFYSQAEPGFHYAQWHAARVFYANAFLNGNRLHKRRKNLREKGVSLVDMENLEMEGILKERCF